jgi:hypothetical protein
MRRGYSQNSMQQYLHQYLDCRVEIFIVGFDNQQGKIPAPILLINAMHLGKTPQQETGLWHASFPTSLKIKGTQTNWHLVTAHKSKAEQL